MRPKIFSPTWASPEVVSTKKEGREKVARRRAAPEVETVSKNVLREFGANRQKPPKMTANQGPRNEGPDSEAGSFTKEAPSHGLATGDCKDTDTVSTKLADSQASEACTKSQAYAYPPRLARVGVLKSPTEKSTRASFRRQREDARSLRHSTTR